MTQNKGYPYEFIEKVRTASNIVDIAKTYMPLKQKGQDFWGCCPFHSEKTPSFKVSASNQFYYCFGCRASGNVFSLVMHMERMSWRESLEFLAKRANLELPKLADNKEWDEERRKKEKIFGALELARDYYCRNLYKEKNKKALDYLHNRGIDEELIKLFRIGYSDSWSGVVEELKSKNISENTMKDAGIVGSGDNGRVWDSQFERITFSIHDVYGNCIGFTGRTMSNDENLAKYKNTAETMVFSKSNIVYGIDVMKEKTKGRKIDGLIVVEGNVDEIAMIKNGFYNTVACMGTAFTKFHAGIMSRFGHTVYLCLDGDNAGEKATLKSIETLKEAGLTVRIISLPNKQDPDEFLKDNGAEAMTSLIKNSLGDIEFKLYYIKKHSDLADNTGKADYLRQAVSILSSVESPAEREFYFPEVSKTLGIEVSAIRNSITESKKVKTEKAQPTIYSVSNVDNNTNIEKSGVSPATIRAEAFVVASLLHNKIYADKKDLPEINNKIYKKIIEEGLKFSDINDKLDDKELEEIKPLIAMQFGGSNENQIIQWQDCIKYLKIEELKKKRDKATGLLEKKEIIKEIQELKQTQKIEEKKNG